MSDRVTYRRLVNLGEYEHLLLEVSKEFGSEVMDQDAVRNLVEDVDKWAALARRKAVLERDLVEATHALEWVKTLTALPEDPEWKNAVVRVERIMKDIHSLQDEWGR